MFKKILKWTGLVLGTVVLSLGLFYLYVSINIGQRTEKKYSFAPEKLEISQDKALLAQGAHLTAIKGCKDCHGTDLGGKVVIDDKALGRLVAANLTKGRGGLPASYTTTDWVRALRHGVDANGQALLFMPSHETTLLSATDMAAIIAYCQNLPPVHTQLPSSELGPVVKVMAYFDKMPLLSVEKIDHGKPMVTQVDTLEGVAMGKYLAVSCSGCHGTNLEGGDPVAPGFPPVPTLTKAGHVGKWTKAQFVQTLRTGKTPEGKQLKNENMPWQMTAQYTDKELASLYHYCQSLQ